MECTKLWLCGLVADSIQLAKFCPIQGLPSPQVQTRMQLHIATVITKYCH